MKHGPDNQQLEQRFDAALKQAMNAGLPRRMPDEIRAKLGAAIAAEAASAAPTAPLRVLQGGRRKSLAWVAWPAAVAAALVLGLYLGNVYGAGSAQNDPITTPEPVLAAKPGDAKLPLNFVSAKAASLMLNLGTKARDELETYKQKIPFKHTIPVAYKTASECGELTPVGISAGDIDTGGKEKTHYDAVCFCSGFLKIGDENVIPGAGKLVRIVLFMVDGDVLPKPCQLDSCGCWFTTSGGFSFLAKYIKERDMTVLVSVPGEADNARAHALAEPLLLDASVGATTPPSKG